MLNNKLKIKYKKESNLYIILDNVDRVIWCYDFNDILIFNNNILSTKQFKKYDIFFKNISIFGLCNEQNFNDFN